VAEIIGAEYYIGPARDIAKRLKDPFDSEAMEIAAKVMGPHVPENAVLVPVPDSTGTNKANEYLATHILSYAPGAIVRSVVRRVTPVPSSRLLRKAGKRGLTAKQHAASMAQVAPLPPGRPIVAIDNVATEGNTINGVEIVLNVPIRGLVYAVATRDPGKLEKEVAKETPSMGAKRRRKPEQPRRPRLCVTGSRNYEALWKVERYLMALPRHIIVVHGGASGVDEAADFIARGLGFEVEVVPANWARYGRAAGPIRNREMVETCDHVVAFWDGQSKGTLSAIEAAEDLGVEVEVILDEGVAEGGMTEPLRW
jgi:hypothetical protein